ncbi:MAG TPA: protein adenylyltransferase SelO family protein [Terriglobales bacterium]|nr:protein adenylyltransferase SelO family protein [Terriglobales bacterium]
MEAYDPSKVYSSIDHVGRYAYGNQPRVALWNLTRLAESLLPLLAHESGSEEAGLAAANEALSTFEPQFEASYGAGIRRKLGLVLEREGDAALGENLLQCMAANHADFTLTFRRLCDAADGPEGDAGVRALFANPSAYDGWAVGWRRRLKEEVADGQTRTAAMRRMNPVFVPRNHLVEAALDAANSHQNFRPLEDLLAVILQPYDERPELERYSAPARPEELILQTFCGT